MTLKTPVRSFAQGLFSLVPWSPGPRPQDCLWAPCRMRSNHLHPCTTQAPSPAFRTRASTPLSPSGLRGSWLQGKQSSPMCLLTGQRVQRLVGIS